MKEIYFVLIQMKITNVGDVYFGLIQMKNMLYAIDVQKITISKKYQETYIVPDVELNLLRQLNGLQDINRNILIIHYFKIFLY